MRLRHDAAKSGPHFFASLSQVRAAPETAIGVFGEKYEAKYPKAAECLTKDRHTLLAFYDFPAEGP